MKKYKQIDCFSINFKFFKFLGIYPYKGMNKCYKVYSKCFVAFFIVLYNFLTSINFFFLPPQMDLVIEELIFYFTELSVMSKVLTFVLLGNEIVQLFYVLESDVFQPDTEKGINIIENAKKFNVRYWRAVAVTSFTSNLTHILSSFFAHLFTGQKLTLIVCSYSFLSESFKESYIYPLYFYQSFGMHFQMLNNVNVDTFFLGLMILAIAQLDIIDDKLRRVTDKEGLDTKTAMIVNANSIEDDSIYIEKLNKNIVHFDEVAKYCKLIEQIFSVTLFVQFSAASIIICVCLFRFTLPASREYYVFLLTYMLVMVIQILVPCWFGTRIILKSSSLSVAIYNCDWTPRSRRFKGSLRLLVERFNRPITIIGWKMFPMSLMTFTPIIHSAYSFFTLLRHMQPVQN